MNDVIEGVISYFGWPRIPARSFFEEQARCESCSAAFNPLATTYDMPNATNYNSAGVRDYDSLEDGIYATVHTLDPNIDGGIDYYPAIRAALTAGRIDEASRGTVAREMQTWGTGNFADEIAGAWQMTQDSSTTETPITAVIPDTTPSAPSASSASIVDATLESRVSALESNVSALNSAVLARLRFLAESFGIAANPNQIPE